MGSVGTLLRPAALAAGLLLLSTVFHGGALGNDIHFRIGQAPVQSMRVVEPDAESCRLENHFQAFMPASTSTSVFNDRVRFRNEQAAAQWLSKVTCRPVGPVPFISFSMLKAGDDFYAGVKDCLQVELDWSYDMVSILPTLLEARLLWASSPAIFSISHRSWSVLDADDLALLIQFRADTTWTELRMCVGYPPNWISEESRLANTLNGGRADETLAEMTKNAPRLGIEQLHVALHDYDPPQALEVRQAHLAGDRLQRGLPDAPFSMLATNLLAAPFLRDVSVSWDVPRSNSATVRSVEAMATALTKSSSVRKLAVMRTCSGRAKRVSPDPLAAFTRLASAGETWPTIETLSLTTYRCNKDLCPPSSYDLKALPTLAAHMPALRRVHLETRFKKLHLPYARLQVPALESIVPLLPPHVAITIAVNFLGIAGVAGASSLAQLGDALSDGYAVVVLAPRVSSGVPARQMELVGHGLLLNTTAMTLVPIADYDSSSLNGDASDWFARRIPRLERLSIDSRWTSYYCNEQVAKLPMQVASRLRALMVHTLVLWDDVSFRAVEALQNILQVGHGISVVDLGIEIPRDISDAHTDAIRSLAVTLSRMPLLESSRFTLTARSATGDIRALADLIRGIVPRAHVTTILKEESRQYANFHHRKAVVWWEFSPSVEVPPAPEFPSPRQFFKVL